MKFENKSITAILAIVVGILFIVVQSRLLEIAFTLLGFALAIMGIIHLAKQEVTYGVSFLAAGLIIAVCGWRFTSLTLYVSSVLIIVYCIMNFIMMWQNRWGFTTFSQKAHALLKPIIGIFAGVSLLFNQGGTVSWVFVFAGIVFVIEGALMLTEHPDH